MGNLLSDAFNLSSKRTRGALAGAGAAVADTGRLLVVDQLEKTRQRRLADYRGKFKEAESSLQHTRAGELKQMEIDAKKAEGALSRASQEKIAKTRATGEEGRTAYQKNVDYIANIITENKDGPTKDDRRKAMRMHRLAKETPERAIANIMKDLPSYDKDGIQVPNDVKSRQAIDVYRSIKSAMGQGTAAGAPTPVPAPGAAPVAAPGAPNDYSSLWK